MHTNHFEHWPQMGKMSFGPMMELNGITTRLCSEIARENLQAINEWMHTVTEHTQNLSQAKGLEEVLALQARFASQTAPHICQHTQHVMETVMEGMAEYRKCFEKGMEKGMNEYTKEKKSMQEKAQHSTQHHK